MIPWMRPEYLATDEASSVDVALHALNWYEETHGKVDALILLQPTSPLRTLETVERGITLFVNNQSSAVIGVSPIREHPMWALKNEGKFVVPFLETNGLNTRSQDLAPLYIVNGCLYIISPIMLRANHSFMGGNLIPLVIESAWESMDIDSLADVLLANYFLQHIKLE